MVTKKDLIIVVVAIVCIVSTLFIVIPIRSSSIKPYDPWIDTDDNGQIDMGDVVNILDAFGATGTAINKTELLLELQARIDSLNATNLELQSKVDLLNASLLESQSRIDDLNTSLTSQINVLITQMATMNMTISELRTDIAVLDMTKLGKPDYDSGWTAIAVGTNMHFNHGLGTKEVLVYVIGKSYYGINQIQYGSDYSDEGTRGYYWWNLETNGIDVVRCQNDEASVQVRVILWKIPQP